MHVLGISKLYVLVKKTTMSHRQVHRHAMWYNR